MKRNLTIFIGILLVLGISFFIFHHYNNVERILDSSNFIVDVKYLDESGNVFLGSKEIEVIRDYNEKGVVQIFYKDFLSDEKTETFLDNVEIENLKEILFELSKIENSKDKSGFESLDKKIVIDIKNAFHKHTVLTNLQEQKVYFLDYWIRKNELSK